MILFYCKVLGCSARLLEHQCKEHLISKHGVTKFKDDWNSSHFTWVEVEI